MGPPARAGDGSAVPGGGRASAAVFPWHDLTHAGMGAPLTPLGLAPPPRAHTVVANGRLVVCEGRLLTGDEDQIARELAATCARLRG